MTLNADSATAGGYLAGEYGEYGWIKVPFEDVELKADESMRIMQYAANALQKPGLNLTYADVYGTVKEFNCGAYFTPEFLAANPEFEVTLELRLYDPDDADGEGYLIGESYVFTAEDAVAPELPGAKVEDTPAEEMSAEVPLTFAKKFTALEPSVEQGTYLSLIHI